MKSRIFKITTLFVIVALFAMPLSTALAAATGITGVSASVAENTTAAGTAVATGGTGPYTYALACASPGGDEGKFDIIAVTGVLTFKDAPNYEVPTDGGVNNTYDICVRATDTDTNTYDKNFAVTVTDVTEAATDITGTLTVAENVIGAAGTLSATGGVGTPAWSLTNLGAVCSAGGVAGDISSFGIDGSTGVVSTLSGLDFEAGATRKICVQVANGGETFQKAFTVAVADVNEAPTDITKAVGALSVAENAVDATPITNGTFSTVDQDTGDTFTYTLATSGTTCTVVNGADNGYVKFVGNVLKVLNPPVINYETNPTLEICVQSQDAIGLNFQKAFVVTVTNVDETPTDISLSASTVLVTSAVDTEVGTLTTTDVDAGDTFTYSLVTDIPNCGGGDGGAAGNTFFKIGTDKLLVKTALTTGAKNICVRSTDSGALSYTKPFVITVTIPVWTLSGKVSFYNSLYPACSTLKLGGGLIANFDGKTGPVSFADGTYSISNIVDGTAGDVTITQPSDGYSIPVGNIASPGVKADRTVNFTATGLRSISGTFTGAAADGLPRVPSDGTNPDGNNSGATVTLATCVTFKVPKNGISATNAFTISGLPPKAFVLTPAYDKGALPANPIAAFSTSQYANTTYSNLTGKAFTFTWAPFTISGSFLNRFGGSTVVGNVVTLTGTVNFAGVNKTATVTSSTYTNVAIPFLKKAGTNDPMPYTGNFNFTNAAYQDFVFTTGNNPQTFDNNKTNNVTAYGASAIYGAFTGYAVPVDTVVNFGAGGTSTIEEAGKYILGQLEPKAYVLAPTATGIVFTNVDGGAASQSKTATPLGAVGDTIYAWNTSSLPAMPTLTAPADNAFVDLVNPKSPTFTWTAAAGATSYDIRVSTSPTFPVGTTTKTVALGNVTTYTPAVGDIYTLLASGVKVYWGVRANIPGTPGTPYTYLTGGMRGFTPTNKAPTAMTFTFGTGLNLNKPIFTWTPPLNPPAGSVYKVEYGKSAAFPATVTTIYAPASGAMGVAIPANSPTVTYSYRVTLVNAAHTVDYSPVSNVVVSAVH